MAKDYLHYTTDDFIADEYFQRWVKFPDRETEAFWKNWMNKHPAQRDDIMKASAFINHLSFREDIPQEEEIEASLNRSLQRIREKESSWKVRFGSKMVLKKIFWVTAISAAVFLSFSLWQNYESKPLYVEVVTNNREIKKMMLPDSTLVTLNANSSLKYASGFNEEDTREVWLKGEAFFNVKHLQADKKNRHFIVHSGALNVEVLGTSFNIKKRNDTYNVSLNTGNIKINLNDGEVSTIYLQSGDFFQYSPKEKTLLKKKVKPELYSHWKDEKMVLDNTKLSEVADLIHDIYGYNTIIANKDLADDKLSGTILLRDEETFFHALSLALNVVIIKNNNDITFQPKTKTK